MANVIISPNMLLPVPIQGQDPGPQFAIDINSCMAIIDGHNHTIGSGVQITPAGLNINSPLTMNDNILTDILALTFAPQTSDPGVNSLYEKGVDLYYEDGNGNVIRITQSGSVSGSPGTITGLPSGTASASFAAGTFVFESATLTAANIDAGSYIFRNNTASSFGVTVSPPNALGANYSLTLPAIPPQTNVMTIDVSGNMGSITYDAVGQDMSSVGADAIAASRTRAAGQTVGVGGVATGGVSGNFFTSSTSFVQVTTNQVTITTSGRPVMIVVNGSTDSRVGITGTSGQFLLIGILRNLTVVHSSQLQITALGTSATGLFIPPSSISFVDFPTAGTYTYNFDIAVSTGSATGFATNTILTAYEL